MDVELVIKIPEEVYKNIQSHDWKNGERWFSEEWKAIHNGTPLPKGHGKIIDADKIEWYGCTTAFDCLYQDRECKDCSTAECSKTQVDNIPAIIEADTESEEKG